MKPDHEKNIVVCEAIKIGASLETALLVAGYLPSDIMPISDLIRSKNPEWVKFSNDIAKCFAVFELEQLQKIVSEGGDTGAKWILERRIPWRYGRQINCDDIPKQITDGRVVDAEAEAEDEHEIEHDFSAYDAIKLDDV